MCSLPPLFSFEDWIFSRSQQTFYVPLSYTSYLFIPPHIPPSKPKASPTLYLCQYCLDGWIFSFLSLFCLFVSRRCVSSSTLFFFFFLLLAPHLISSTCHVCVCVRPSESVWLSFLFLCLSHYMRWLIVMMRMTTAPVYWISKIFLSCLDNSLLMLHTYIHIYLCRVLFIAYIHK